MTIDNLIQKMQKIINQPPNENIHTIFKTALNRSELDYKQFIDALFVFQEMQDKYGISDDELIREHIRLFRLPQFIKSLEDLNFEIARQTNHISHVLKSNNWIEETRE